METTNNKLIATFTFPNYLREVEASKSQRPKYYEWDGEDIKAKGKKLLKKYIKNDKETLDGIAYRNGCVYPIDLKEGFYIGYFDKKYNKLIGILSYYDLDIKGFNKVTDLIYLKEKKELNFKGCKLLLIDNEFNPVISNETQAGKPRRVIIKGQDMYSGVLNEFIRAKIVNELKSSYYNKIKENPFKDVALDVIREKIKYPLYIHLEIHDTIRNKYDRSKTGDGIRWDVGNRAYPYIKTFVDFLVNGYNEIEPIIEDDDRLHVMGEGYSFHSIEEEEQNKLIFKIYKVC